MTNMKVGQDVAQKAIMQLAAGRTSGDRFLLALQCV